MFIQLTRTDGVPVWLNASFVVTIEPTRGGGSIVVPIGDGLDYEVREPPEKVLAMLEGAPAPKVVPVPPPKALVPRPDDVSPDPEPSGEGGDGERKAEPEPQKKGRRTKKAPAKKVPDTAPAGEQAGAQAEDGAQEPAPKAKRASSRKKSADAAPAAPALPDGFEKIVEDLKSRKCRTVKRMHNAIKSFHGKTDSGEIDAIIGAMAARGCILVEADGRVNWATQVMQHGG
jgi:uncharacterized protein YlzI (FlbEa/FlbD family)